MVLGNILVDATSQPKFDIENLFFLYNSLEWGVGMNMQWQYETSPFWLKIWKIYSQQNINKGTSKFYLWGGGGGGGVDGK